MTFFSDEDNAARKRAANPPMPTVKEVTEHSHQVARKELDRALQHITKDYRSGSSGIAFSFDKSPFAGSMRGASDQVVDNEIMVKELVRLIEAETGLSCELNANNGPVRSGFYVSLSQRPRPTPSRRLTPTARPRSEERYPVPAPELKFTRKGLAARRRRRNFLSSLPLIPAGIIIAGQWPNLKANWDDIGSMPLWEMPWTCVALVFMLISIIGLGVTARLNSRDEQKVRAEEEMWS